MAVSRTQTLKTPFTVNLSGGVTVPIGASIAKNSLLGDSAANYLRKTEEGLDGKMLLDQTIETARRATFKRLSQFSA